MEEKMETKLKRLGNCWAWPVVPNIFGPKHRLCWKPISIRIWGEVNVKGTGTAHCTPQGSGSQLFSSLLQRGLVPSRHGQGASGGP